MFTCLENGRGVKWDRGEVREESGERTEPWGCGKNSTKTQSICRGSPVSYVVNKDVDSVHKLITDEQTDRRVDEGTGREHYAFGQSRLAYG